MTLGQKLKEIRRVFGLSQESLAEIMNVSRQAITKWESDDGLPDVSNLQELSKIFNLTVDYLLDNDNSLPALSMKKELDKEKYEMNQKGYIQIIKDNYTEPWEVYELLRSKNHSKLAWIVSDFIVGAGPMETLDALDDTTPYYLVKKDGLKLLVNIHDYVLEVIELPDKINDKKFIYGKNKFKQFKKIL
ncbi:MAG: helix-turn-helix transcriptional regulator [Bacilli bacterium]|nr:helix-turn-helix transcriptional regulator [Bacilli bacterium]